jgi:hypothetical protein
MGVMLTFRRQMNIKSLEHLLPPSPPLAGRWDLYGCSRCGESFRVDRRVHRLPLVPALVRGGLLHVACPECGCDQVRFLGLLVS